MATIDTIRSILETNLDIAPESVTEDSTFDSLGIDSLDMVELICELEDRCEVDFGDLRRSRIWWPTSTACNAGEEGREKGEPKGSPF